MPSAASAVRIRTVWPVRSRSRAGSSPQSPVRVAALIARLVAVWDSGAPEDRRRASVEPSAPYYSGDARWVISPAS